MDTGVSTDTVVVSRVCDDGSCWAIGEGGPAAEDVAWWTALKSVIPSPPKIGLTYQLTALCTGSRRPEVVALEGPDGVGMACHATIFRI
jgi:hypothetical protein